MSRRIFCKLLLVVVAVFSVLVLSAVLSAQGRSEDGLARAKAAQERHTDELMAKPGVVGTAVGLNENGQHTVMVLLEKPGVGGIPNELDGVPVHPVVTGKIYALKPPKPEKPGRPPTGKPAAPTNLTAEPVSSSQIGLTWKDNANNETGFKIERDSEVIDTVGANVTSYSDTGLQASTTYTYRVRAYNNAGNSSYSNVASATTDAGPVEDPIGPRPAPIGVSTGHPNITAGTIGCRVKDAQGNVYALSNNHVYADENRASIGDNVLQPGPYDGGENPRDAIGTLSAFEPIVFSRRASNTIDAAIALSSIAQLGNATPAGDSKGYGTPSSETVDASVGMAVQKYGRTTGLTTGYVDAVNATVNVQYSRGVARFVNQIIIKPAGFSLGGDSGSLIVTDYPDSPDDKKPVGLLFAGSSTITVANPIGPVLARFGVSIDDE
jgi:hypothetical protein